MAEERIFTLVGKFDDQITKKLKGINDSFKNLSKTVKGFSKDIDGIRKDFDKLGETFSKMGEGANKSFNKMTNSLEDAGKAAGKVRDTVSQIGEGVKGLDGIGESLESAARAAGRAEDGVYGIGEAAGKANRQADDLINTLLKANALVNIGDAMAQGFSRGMGMITGTARRGAGIVAKQYRSAMEDQMADIKAQSGIQGSFTLAGFKGSAQGGGVSFGEAGKMYKAYDREIAEMIRTSAAPTAKVVELQRYTLDTIGPLALAAEGVAKGTDIRKIDPTKIKQSAKTYGAFLEKAALLSQGTGTAGFRVAGGIEQLITRGKIDTTIDFFTDNIMLMKQLEKEGFAGRGAKAAKMMQSTDAERFAAVLRAFEAAQSGESTKAMAMSVQGSMQALEDTIFNSTVGVIGMANTFTQEEQTRVNTKIQQIYDRRIASYKAELSKVEAGSKRAEQISADIEQTQKTREELIKKNEELITTPFLAINLAFTQVIQRLTEAFASIGPIWTEFSIGILDFSMKYIQPLADNLKNVASDIRAGMPKAEAFGRIAGEIVKGLGEALGAIGRMIADPKGPVNKIQSEFVKGFMAAFKNDPGLLEKAKAGIRDGLWAIFNKLLDFFLKIITLPELRPLVLGAFAIIFGPPLIGAIISGLVPLIITSMGSILARVAQIAISKLVTPRTPSVVPTVVTDLGPSATALPPVKPKGLLPPAGGTTASAGLVDDVAKTTGVFGRLRNIIASLFGPLNSIARNGVNWSAAMASAGAALRGFGPALLSAMASLKNLPSLVVGLVTALTNVARTGLNWSKILAPIGTFLTNIKGGLTGFASGLKNPIKVLGKFGGVATILITAFEVISNLLSGKDIFQSLAKSAPALVGTLIGAAFGPVGAIIGGMIGQWLSQFKPVTDFFEGVFRGLGAVVGGVTDTFGPILSGLGTIILDVLQSFGSLISIFNPFASSVGAASGQIDMMQAVIIAIKVALTPVVAAFQLLEQIINALVVGFKYLEAGLLGLRLVLANINPFGDPAAKKRLEEEYKKSLSEASGSVTRFKTSFDRASKYYQTPATKPEPTNRRGAAPAATPMAPPKPVGTPAPVVPKITTAASAPVNITPLVTAANNTTTNVQQVNQKAAQQLTQLSQINAKTGAANTTNAALVQKTNQTAANTASVKTTSTVMAKNITTSNQLLGNIKSGIQSLSTKMDGVRASVVNLGTKLSGLEGLKASVDRINSTLVSGGTKVKLAIGGTMSRGGGVDQFNPLAASQGLMITSGFRPGDPGWHGVDRARDYAGAPGSMMSFAKLMMGYAPVLKELIYSPLGFGVKNGAVVPIGSFGPKVVADHYDHVHVAYAMGAGNPAFFSTASAADQWEAAMAKKEPIVSSVRAKASEVSSGTYTINAPITINQQPNQDAKALASLVAMELSMAIDEIRNHNA